MLTPSTARAACWRPNPLGDLTAGISVARLSGTDIDVKALVEAADSSFRYGDMTSVAISPDNTILAAALQAEGYHDAGRVALFACNADGSLTLRGLVETGVQPDMVTFAGSSTVLTADEGEPREGYGDGIVDPRGLGYCGRCVNPHQRGGGL